MRAFHVSPQWSRRVLPLAGLASLLCFSDATSGTARASSQELEPFTLVSPDFRDGGPLPRLRSSADPDRQECCSGKTKRQSCTGFMCPAARKALRSSSMTWMRPSPEAGITGRLRHSGERSRARRARLEPVLGRQHELRHPRLSVFGWGGPCPPPDGQIHHYIFTLYALSTPNIAGASLTYEQVPRSHRAVRGGLDGHHRTFRLPLHH